MARTEAYTHTLDELLDDPELEGGAADGADDYLDDLISSAVEIAPAAPPTRAQSAPTKAPAPTKAAALAKAAVLAKTAASAKAAAPAKTAASAKAAAPAKAPADTATPHARRGRMVIGPIKNPHTPAVLKIIDEILVNATDHCVEHAKGPASKRVTYIRVTFEPREGRVAIENDGPGIPVKPHPGASAAAGRPVYIPEVAFGVFLASRNTDKKAGNVKGGINGLGAKLANVHSREFRVETVDSETKQYYLQVFRDRLDVIEPPQIVSLRGDSAARRALTPPQQRSHTRVEFVPAYGSLGYKMAGGAAAASGGAATAAPRLGAADAADLDAWLCLRVHQCAAYVGAKVAVSYNGRRCATVDSATLARALLTGLAPEDAADAVVLTAQAKATEAPYSEHPLNVTAVVLPVGKKAGRRAAAQNMTIVNGVLSNKGSHVLYLKRLMSAAVEEKLVKVTKKRGAKKANSAVASVLELVKAGKAAAKAAAKAPEAAAAPAKAAKGGGHMSVTETLAGVRLVVCGAIPGADWGGQRKDELQVSPKVMEKYALPASFLKALGEAAAQRILAATAGKSDKVVHDKYVRAKHAGKAQRRHTYLLAAEGDSAMTLLRAGLTQQRHAPPGGPTFEWCGMISLQGVVVNAAREVDALKSEAGEEILVRSERLRNTKRLGQLADAWGVDYGRKYAAPGEADALHYGKLLLCVDQDLDGTGKIAALVLVWIFMFWPALIAAGRVGRLLTPLVRVYPRKRGSKVPLLEFYYEEELRAWLAATPNWAADYHEPKFYKGLAGHDTDEVKRMFAPDAFRRAIYTYKMDDCAAHLFKVYFGPAAALRKAALVTPVRHLTIEEARAYAASREILVGRQQLDVDTKAYKQDAINRQIPGAIDGQNPARRKIEEGALMRFGGEAKSKEIKIFQLGGYVADKCAYHHGDASLNGTIIYVARGGPGGRMYPLLTGVGQFGSRHGDKAGSPRYIAVKLSPLMRAAYPPEDRWLLPYVEVDGARAEPRYYVPVVPLAVLESNENVSEGWSHRSFGRDQAAVLAAVEAYIAGDAELVALGERLAAEPLPVPAALLRDLRAAARRWPLPPSLRDNDGEVREYRGQPYSFGVYAWDAASATITITELPIDVDTDAYLLALLKPTPARRGAKAAAKATATPNARALLIEDINDHSSAAKVHIEIRLAPGAYEKILEKYGDETIDPVEDFLMLRTSLKSNLNYYSATGGVLEFEDCYLGPLLYWASRRRALYAARLERQRVLLELRILEEEQILRYVEIAAELRLKTLKDVTIAEAALRARGFPTLDRALLHRPEYATAAELRAAVVGGPRASHDYILDLKERELVRSAVLRRTEALARLRAELATVEAQQAERPPGASLWRAEIAEFVKVAAAGLASEWSYKATK
jgi:DNA topoisomerase-2